MTRAAPNRDWLHALEDDLSVKDFVLQVARIFADFADGQPAGGAVWVGWSTLRRCTHQREERLSQALRWLRSHGWLLALPRKNGQRQHHILTVPEPLLHAAALPVAEALPDTEAGPLPPAEAEALPDAEVRTQEHRNTVRDLRSARSLTTAPRSARGAG